MKAVLQQDKAYHYVSDADIISFIEKNSDMKWNNICDFVREQGITGQNGETQFWEKKQFQGAEASKNHNEAQTKWVGGFFEAHPWIERMMVVFDD